MSLIALLKLHFRIPSPILLAAPTHVSVDHLVLLLVRAGLNPLRCGKAAKVSSEVHKWTIERRQEQHPLWDRLEKAREESEALRAELQDMRDARRDMSSDGGGKEADDKDGASASSSCFTCASSCTLTDSSLMRAAEIEGKYRKAWRKFIMLEHKLYSSLLATADVFCATALGSGASKVLNVRPLLSSCSRCRLARTLTMCSRRADGRLPDRSPRRGGHVHRGAPSSPSPFLPLRTWTDAAHACTQPVSLIPLMKGARQATLIGDHKQLPAVVTVRRLVSLLRPPRSIADVESTPAVAGCQGRAAAPELVRAPPHLAECVLLHLDSISLSPYSAS